jgi:hypothetical protein
MKPILNALLFFFVAAWGFTALAQTPERVTQTNRPEATVTSLYREVLDRAPSGLLRGADIQIFAPYLSKSLRRKIELAEACERDWARQNRDEVVKAPFAWSEFGMFSGANERTSPGRFHIESISKAGDGSFQIVVGLTYRPVDGSGSWRVTDHVIQEDGRFVLDDVLFPEEGTEASSTLTGRLSEGCRGPHWVGLR